MAAWEARVDSPTDDLARKMSDELRDSWQVKALIATQKIELGATLLSVLAHTYDDAMQVLMRVAFPGFTSIKPPFLCTAGKVAKNGTIVADLVTPDGRIVKDYVLFRTERHLRDSFRRLADCMKLNDSDRIEMFKCVQRWVVADRRLDPTMNPRDPDAKRLTH